MLCQLPMNERTWTFSNCSTTAKVLFAEEKKTHLNWSVAEHRTDGIEVTQCEVEIVETEIE